MSEVNWTNDWGAFVESVRQAWDTGLSDTQVTEQHLQKRIRWNGVVKKIFVNGDLGVNMPHIHFRLKDKKQGLANYVLLRPDISAIQEWSQVNTGDAIYFETEIERPSPDDPFTTAGIEWANVGEGKGYISVSTRNSRLIEVLRGT